MSELAQTFLIAGLGNPGRQYRANRHNVGFMVVDCLAERLKIAFTRVESRALVTKGAYQSQRLILAKPQTYMNESGASVSTLARYYKVELNNILVAYDDVDLPFGVLRIRPGGGSAGQKGMASIIERLGGDQFPRLRVGIGRPPGRMDAAAYVLQDFPRDESAELPMILERAVDAILVYVSQGLNQAMNQYNGLSNSE
ncbi:MAG: aminoacyl-tRNA hydrolase [Anaerolineales bacterium]|jgi:PTH1 family peptidyl-tRNA hydrolase|nr:aminoacyl-tRNA hydrolase [Anaerolineales bacterium]